MCCKYSYFIWSPTWVWLSCSLKATIHLICHSVGNDRWLCCILLIVGDDLGWWRWTILHKGVCDVRPTVGDPVRMADRVADRVADWCRWGVWWPLNTMGIESFLSTCSSKKFCSIGIHVPCRGPMKALFRHATLAHFFTRHATFRPKFAWHRHSKFSPTLDILPSKALKKVGSMNSTRRFSHISHRATKCKVDTRHSHFQVDTWHCKRFDLDTRHSDPPSWALSSTACTVYLQFIRRGQLMRVWCPCNGKLHSS